MVTRPPLTEAEFQKQVVELAKRHGWMVSHVYRTRTAKGAWRTSTTAVGFPDLVLLRPGQLVFLELKAEGGKASPEQLVWIKTLQSVLGVEAYVVRPSEWDDLVALLTDPAGT